MRSPKRLGGQETFSIWDFTEIVPMEKIQFINNLADKEGSRIHPSEVGMPKDFTRDVRLEVAFKAQGKNQTQMKVIAHDLITGEMYDLAKA